ncbi:MAG TPA: phospholipase D-like domain-containing protein [Caulobacteraceae bacterium]|nr:phospholipase D-like domain-containing protein [Caulobacteraceae bacterium]
MIELELLVGSDEFWRRAAADCAAARRRLLVQAMTFEGDEVGQSVAAAVAAATAADRRVLVDAYSKVVVSDQWVATGNAEIRREARATNDMFRGLMRAGVGVRVTNPFAPLMTNYPARNHKKLIVADDAAYIGGINFSDHNFAWRDFMVRIEDEAAADFLAADFQATWTGAPRPAAIGIDGLTLRSLDGRSNHTFFREIEAMISAARREILVMSAYLTFPFDAPLAAAARRGVAVKLITPLANNKPLVRDYLLDLAARAGFDLRLLPDMNHSKGLLIDGERLVVGSCNFDFVGHEAEEELAAVIDDPGLIADFTARVVAPAMAAALGPQFHAVSRMRSLTARGVLRTAQLVVRATRGSRRTTVEWS